MWVALSLSLFFFFNDTATTELYTLSLHDALPISLESFEHLSRPAPRLENAASRLYERQKDCFLAREDRKSTRLNSSHTVISYAVFCLKKKKKIDALNLTSAIRRVNARLFYCSLAS